MQAVKEISKVQAAAQAAELAVQAAKHAQEGAEAEYLSNITSIGEFSAGVTPQIAVSRKSKYISLFGYPAYEKLCADSRR